MKKFALILLLIFVLILGSAYIFKQTIHKELENFIEKSIKEHSNLNFTKIDLSLSKLIQLEPTIRIENLTIDEGISIKKIDLELFLKPILHKEFIIKKISINEALIRIEEDKNKQARIKSIKFKDTNKNTKSTIKIKNFKLQDLNIKNSKLEYYIYGQKLPFVFENLNLDLKDFNLGQEAQIQAKYNLQTNIFKTGRLKSSGSLGPSTFNTMPIQGRQNLELQLNAIPKIQTSLGKILRLKNKSNLIINSQISGDLLKEITGSGLLTISDLVIGKNDLDTINAQAKINLNFGLNIAKSILNLNSSAGTLSLKSKDQKIGHLNFNFNSAFNLISGYFELESRGKLSGLDIETSLNALSDLRKIISGTFMLDNYHLTLSGQGANLLKSMKVNGSITIKNGSLFILKSITKYKDLGAIIVKNGDQLIERIAGEFVNLSSDFNYENNILHNSNIRIESSDKVLIEGDGSLKQGKWLVYDVNLKIPKVSKPIPVKVRGDLNKPKISPDFKSILENQEPEIINKVIKTGFGAILKSAIEKSKQTSFDSPQQP